MVEVARVVSSVGGENFVFRNIKNIEEIGLGDILCTGAL